MGPVLASNRSFAVVISLLALCFGALAGFGCKDELDLTTTEGIKKALTTKEKLSDAMTEVKGIASDPEKLKVYGSELNQLFLAGSEFDYEVMSYLTKIASPDYKESYIKAIESGDPRLVPLAAGVVAQLNISDAIDALISTYEKATDPEIKRVILDVGTVMVDARFAKIANDLLWEKGPDDVPIANLRYACRALERQADPSTVKTLLRAMFYRDSIGRDINLDCTMALLAIGKVAVPEILAMLRYENEDVMSYIARNSDRMAKETVLLGAVSLLGKLRAAEAKTDLADRIKDPNPIQPPGVLAVKATSDPAWVEWSNLIGQVNQEMIFALNDIGIEGDEAIRDMLLDIYKWVEPYPTKFKKPMEFVNMIETNARVNAALILAANGFANDPVILDAMMQALKDPEFDNDRKLRPAARASIARDLVTYLAIVSQPGWTETVWKFFNDMVQKEFADKPDAKIVFDFVPTRERIAAMEATFKVADECAGANAACYAKYLDRTGDENHFPKIKALFELGRKGSSEHFDLILNRFGDFDPFGVMFAADALARLGRAEDAPKVEAKLAELKATRDAKLVAIFEMYLKPLRFTLLAKTQ